LGQLGLLLCLAGFLVLKLFALRPQLNDDGIYLYGSIRMTEGVLPYRDFFHAHPPLHLAFTAALFSVTGYSFVVAKAMIFAFAALTGALVHAVARKLLARETPVIRESAALAGTCLLLFCETFLLASSDDTGLVQSTALLVAAGALLVHGRPFLGGLIGGCATSTSLQAAPLTLALVLVAATVAGRAPARRVLLGILAALAVVHVLALAIGGRAFVEQVYLFHLAKPPSAGEAWRAMRGLVLDNLPLVAAAALGLLVLMARPGRPRRLGLALTAGLALHLLAVLTRPRVFYWYFLPMLPALALAAAVAVAALARTGASIRAIDATFRPAILRLGAGVLVVLLAFTYRPRRHDLPSPHLPGFADLSHFQWQDAPVVGPLNAPIRSLFWRPGAAPGERRAGVITEYLWRQSVWFDSAPAIVTAVARVARERGSVSLLGDYASVPFVALEAGIPVTGHLVDTTGQRFAAGHLPDADVAALFDRSPDALLLVRSDGSGLTEKRTGLRPLFDRSRELGTYFRRGGARHRLLGRPAGAAD
jgi:hypothetical protein